MKVRVIYADNNYKFDKNPNQILSVCPEYNDLMVKKVFTVHKDGTVSYDGSNGKEKLDRYQLGGLGAVTGQAPVSFVGELNMDARTALPYHGECLSGSIKLLRLPRENINEIMEKGKTNIPNLLDPKWIREVPRDYNPSKYEFFVLLHFFG